MPLTGRCLDTSGFPGSCFVDEFVNGIIFLNRPQRFLVPEEVFSSCSVLPVSGGDVEKREESLGLVLEELRC